MDTIIRKISVGKDYPNGSIHYQIGSRQSLKGRPYKVASITVDKEILERSGNMSYNIYLTSIQERPDDLVGTFLWKTVIGVPVVVENNIDFD